MRSTQEGFLGTYALRIRTTGDLIGTFLSFLTDTGFPQVGACRIVCQVVIRVYPYIPHDMRAARAL